MKSAQYDSRIAHVVLSFALSSTASTLIHQPCDDKCPVASYGYDYVRFTGSVYFGDTVTCNYEVVSADEETGKTIAKVEIANQYGNVVCVAEHIRKFLEFRASRSKQIIQISNSSSLETLHRILWLTLNL